MRKLRVASFVLLGVLSLGSISAHAGIFGRSYVEGTFEYTKLDKEQLPAGVDRNQELYGLTARLGGMENIDVVGGFGVGTWDGTDLTVANVGIQPYWKPEGGSYKVFADAELLYQKAEDDDSALDESDTGYSIGVGSELCASKQLSVVGQVNYVDVGDEDDIEFAGSVNFWITDWLLASGGASYAVDSKAVSLGLALGIGF